MLGSSSGTTSQNASGDELDPYFWTFFLKIRDDTLLKVGGDTWAIFRE
jgi:hypothetical protein